MSNWGLRTLVALRRLLVGLLDACLLIAARTVAARRLRSAPAVTPQSWRVQRMLDELYPDRKDCPVEVVINPQTAGVLMGVVSFGRRGVLVIREDVIRKLRGDVLQAFIAHEVAEFEQREARNVFFATMLIVLALGVAMTSPIVAAVSGARALVTSRRLRRSDRVAAMVPALPAQSHSPGVLTIWTA